MHFFRRVKIPSLFLLLYISPVLRHACADHLILTNGDRISGKLIFFSQNSARMATPAAGIILVDRTSIEKLSTEIPMAINLVSGERIVGQIMAGQGPTVVIRSALLGERILPLDAIDSIHSLSEDVSEAGADDNGHQQEPQNRPGEMAKVSGKGVQSSTPPASNGAKSPEPQQPISIGQKPEDVKDIRKIFLRQVSVLLRPHQVEAEAEIRYTRNQSVTALVNARFRQVQLPLSIRVGMFDRAEGYLTLPVAYVHRQLAFFDSVVSAEEFGIGDAAAGFNYEIARETERWPDIIASAGFTASTGTKPDEIGLSLGSGHPAATFGVQFIKTTDPIALFWGINYAHEFEARHFFIDDVHRVQPGETIGYSFGFGFAVNSDISLSAQVVGRYQSDTKSDGLTVPGSSSEPVYLRSALTYRHSGKTYIEPSLAIGLNDETPDFILGISITHRLGR